MSARILIVEDNPANLELMRYLLHAYGYVTLTARDGEEGLNIARAQSLDLVVCDTRMPGVDGFDFVREIKRDANLRALPVIAVTAAAMVGDRETVLAAGFDGYLAKPIMPETFVQQVAEFLPPQLRRAPPHTSNALAAAPEAARLTEGRILVVDNLQLNLDLFASIFTRSGYQVVSTLDAREALALARESPPDIIVSDVCMPAGSGYDFIREVKADPRLREIPFVFVTSTMTGEDERQKGIALGAARYLFRPLEPEKLLEAVRSCLDTPGRA
jgi:two-component system cell cycle response regulator